MFNQNFTIMLNSNSQVRSLQRLLRGASLGLGHHANYSLQSRRACVAFLLHRLINLRAALALKL